MRLRLEHVSKSYAGKGGEVRALSDISMELNEGEFVAVMGPSGCGKTTLLLTAGGLLKPDSGDVRIAGENPYELSSNDRAGFRGRTVGFVFQQFHLVPYLSVLDNVLTPALAAPNANGALKRRASELVRHFGLEHRQQHVPSELSSGERQRVALARALLNQPALLLADEPTGNLDSENAEAVLGHLKEFAAAGGAVLLVTHDDRARPFADRIVRLRDGSILPESTEALSGT